jgi:hypothetical protein
MSFDDSSKKSLFFASSKLFFNLGHFVFQRHGICSLPEGRRVSDFLIFSRSRLSWIGVAKSSRRHVVWIGPSKTSLPACLSAPPLIGCLKKACDGLPVFLIPCQRTTSAEEPPNVKCRLILALFWCYCWVSLLVLLPPWSGLH